MRGSLFGSLPDIFNAVSPSEDSAVRTTSGGDGGTLILKEVNETPPSDTDPSEGTTTDPSSTEGPNSILPPPPPPIMTKPTEDPPARERPADGTWPERQALSFTRSLVFYGTGAITSEHEKACRYIMEARGLRAKYYGEQGVRISPLLLDSSKEEPVEVSYRFNEDGIADLYLGGCTGQDGGLVHIPSIDEFVKDYERLEVICKDGAMRSFW